MSAVRQETSGLGGEPPEATRFTKAQAGCIESLNQLMARHNGLVQAVVRQQVLGGLPFEEALQAGRIGLWRALLGFDPAQGSAFSTCAWTCIKHHVWRAVKAHEGEPRYGYASLPLLLADPSRRFHIVLADYFSAINARLEVPFAAQLLQPDTLYPSLHVRDVVSDAAFGYSCVLRVVHEHLGARRVLDLRAHQTDQDKTLWPLRGYDDKGRPICAFGYPLTSNGFDFEKRRHKWFCDRVCQKGQAPVVVITGLPTPICECPYLHTDSNYAQILNVGFSFKNDGSCRLVRDIAFDSPAWKLLYHRARNASESRNARPRPLARSRYRFCFVPGASDGSLLVNQPHLLPCFCSSLS